jgi:multicomponent Na+:H+ antiporter subunit D
MVTAFLAATATKVAYYVLARFLFNIFGVQLAFGALPLDEILLVLAVGAMFVGSTVAIYQRDVKRLLAFSSLAQIGYMVLGLALANSMALTGGIVHLFNHALMKSGLFLVMAAVVVRLGSTQLEDLAGLGRRMPYTAAAFVIGGLGLVGVPLTAGFVSKWYLLLGALEAGRPLLAWLLLLSSLLALVYVWRVVEVFYFHPDPPGAEAVEEAPFGLLLTIYFLLGATIYFGIFTGQSAGIAERAALQLLAPPGGLP